MQKSNYLKFAIKLAKESGNMLEKMQNKAKIKTYKGKEGDFALDADIKSEKYIMKAIKKKFPTHTILTEESGEHLKDSDYTWIIDPLEGTLNYAHKLPIWAVNIALWYKGQALLGVVYEPKLNELFYAEKGKGAYLNGKRIKVNKDKEVLKSFFTGNVKHFCELNISRHLLRYYGCAGVELAYVAAGRFTARVKLSGKDVFGNGAGTILITEAGGKITDPRGKKWNLDSNGIIASNGKMHDKIIKLIK